MDGERISLRQKDRADVRLFRGLMEISSFSYARTHAGETCCYEDDARGLRDGRKGADSSLKSNRKKRRKRHVICGEQSE
jgi:hypothetical protein